MRRRNQPALTSEQQKLKEAAMAIKIPFEKVARPIEYQVAAKAFNDSLNDDQQSLRLVVNYVNGKAVA